MRECQRKLGVGCMAAGLAAAMVSWTLASEAQAQVNVGLEAGVAFRSASPSLDPGPAVGAHLELKPLPFLAVGGYYLYYDLALDDVPSTVSDASFRAWGGRVRAILPVPESNLRPYFFAGLGRVGTDYPTEEIIPPDVVAEVPRRFRQRDGWFLEVPVGLGLGLTAADILMLSADFAIRPSFEFHGSAFYEEAADTSMGYTFMLGASLDL